MASQPKAHGRKPLDRLEVFPANAAFGVEGAVPVQYTARPAALAARTEMRRGLAEIRGVAQPGRALRSGRRSRRFKSCHPDH